MEPPTLPPVPLPPPLQRDITGQCLPSCMGSWATRCPVSPAVPRQGDRGVPLGQQAPGRQVLSLPTPGLHCVHPNPAVQGSTQGAVLLQGQIEGVSGERSKESKHSAVLPSRGLFCHFGPGPIHCTPSRRGHLQPLTCAEGGAGHSLFSWGSQPS